MNDVITKYKEYFKLITAYHKDRPLSSRKELLAGFIQLNTKNHPDPTTRGMLAKFYAKEILNHGQVSSKPSDNR